jgi:hypothetical protein
MKPQTGRIQQKYLFRQISHIRRDNTVSTKNAANEDPAVPARSPHHQDSPPKQAAQSLQKSPSVVARLSSSDFAVGLAKTLFQS